MGQKYFLGANKLEYMTRFDADNYGGGCIGQREVVKSIWTPVYDVPSPIEDKGADSSVSATPVVPQAPVTPVAEVPTAPIILTEVHGGNEPVTDEQKLTILKNIAKEMGIPGWALYKDPVKLQEKIESVKPNSAEVVANS